LDTRSEAGIKHITHNGHWEEDDMTSLLAHIRIRKGTEERWEATIREQVDRTLANETEVIRYKYWKGQAPLTYYALSFTSKLAFFEHQDADYHRTPMLAELTDNIRLEFLDPVEGTSPLPHTEDPPLPEDAEPDITEWETLTPIRMAPWW
jgi:hypothetical protein|tara:strand:+ start:174 stop:623 length:450 start_codon:yes stop_codon:yes gene_type:complete